MSIFALGDLHLSLGTNKTMEVFGPAWDRYVQRIEENWRAMIKPEDTVLVPGDISWAMYLSETKADFDFLESLPGRKLICRGNHDYWWTTVHKMEDYFAKQNYKSLQIVRHNAVVVEDSVISGTRGWVLPNDSKFSAEDKPIYERELARLRLCAEAIEKADPEHSKRRIMMLHYPPVTKDNTKTEWARVLDEYKIDLCVYGHLHGRGHSIAFEGTISDSFSCQYKCVAADFLGFKPLDI